MRCDHEGKILCAFGKCKGHAAYMAQTDTGVMPLCASHRVMLEFEGIPTEPLPNVRLVAGSPVVAKAG